MSQERTSWPEAKKAMSDPNNILKMIVAVSMASFAAGGVYFVLQSDIRANAEGSVETKARVAIVEQEVEAINETLKELVRHDIDKTKTINWIGAALQEIATAQNVDLPVRPLIPEN